MLRHIKQQPESDLWHELCHIAFHDAVGIENYEISRPARKTQTKKLGPDCR